MTEEPEGENYFIDPTMELVRIMDDGSPQWGSLIFGDGQQQYIPDFLTLDGEHSGGQQYLILDSNSSMLPVLDSSENFTILASGVDSDDGEIPSHTLDHMYAKKPREPGTEQIKPTRRRSKKKEQMMSQFYVQEMIPESPKINIIRQRLPIGTPIFKPLSRPKILHNSASSMRSTSTVNHLSTSTSACASTVYQSRIKTNPVEYQSQPVQSNKSTATIKRYQSVVYEDCEIPQPGAVVTVDGIDHHIPASPRKIKPEVNSTGVVSRVQLAFSDVHTLPNNEEKEEEEEPESELFFDIPMEDTEEMASYGVDVDFDEIALSGNPGVIATGSSPGSSHLEMVSFINVNQLNDCSPTNISSIKNLNCNANTNVTTTSIDFNLELCRSFTGEKLRSRGKKVPSVTGESIFVGSNCTVTEAENVAVIKPEIPSNKSGVYAIESQLLKLRRAVSPLPLFQAVSRVIEQSNVVVAKTEKVVGIKPNSTPCTNRSQVDSKIAQARPSKVTTKLIPSPTRRSTRPVKAPSRLDDIEDVQPKKKRR